MDVNNNNNGHEAWEEVMERMEPGELLEDCWFFDNLLRTKPRMLRSMSDPCTSSKCNQQDDSPPGKSYEETYASIKKLNVASSSECGGQNRERKSSNHNDNRPENRKTLSSSSSKGLHRAPSLPTTFHLQEAQEDEEEVEFSMGKLIRQASMKRSDNLPPRQQLGPKVFARDQSLSMHNKMRRKVDAESVKLENPRRVSRWDLIRELQGFKDMDRKDRSLTTDGRGPPVPKMGRGNGKKSSEDMKAQIKFWARAVASNVHQEC